MKPYDDAVNYLLTNLETVCTYLFPAGKREGPNYVVGNIAGQAGHSFSIAIEPAAKRGLYKDFANGDKGSRNLAHLWKVARGIPEDNHARFFQDLTSFSGHSFNWQTNSGHTTAIDWPRWLAAFASADAQRLATHRKRQYQVATIEWFHVQGHLGVYRGLITFAMRDAAGDVVGLNRWFENEGVLKFIKSPTLFVLGDPATATEGHIHESIWDLIAMVDRTGWHLDPTKLLFCTWGAANHKLIKDRIPPTIQKLYVWEQRDLPDPKTGRIANQVWQAGISRAAERALYLVRIPEPHKDANDWTIDGATAEEIGFACKLATLYQAGPQPAPQPPRPTYQTLPQEFPPAEERPCYHVYETAITINGREFRPGVYYHEVIGRGSDRYPQDTWICGILRIKAKTATIKNRNFGRLLEYQSSNGIQRTWSMPMELLAGDGAAILARLLDDGLEINQSDKNKILRYIAEAQPAEFFQCATRTGWNTPSVFVQTEEIITADPTTAKVWFQSTSKTADYSKGGKIEDWKTELAAKAQGNSYLMFAISFGLAGPFMEPLGLRGIGFHLFGDSSSGKTSITEAAASVWGHGHDFMQTWNLTANGIETVCVEHTDTLLALDEIKEIDARDLDRVAYSVVNGQGKIRSDRSGQARTPLVWRVALFSTGEHSVRARLAEAAITIKTGQEMRLVDVPVIDEKSGIFSNLHGNAKGAEFATQLRAAASLHYGHAGPAIVRAILRRDRGNLQKLHQEIVACFSVTNAQEGRVAEMFAAVALAGEIAAYDAIVPWQAATSGSFGDSEPVNAAVVLFNRWKENRESAGPYGSEHAKILRAINDFIERNESRFSSIQAQPYRTKTGQLIEPPVIRDRAGYFEDFTNGPRVYLFTNGGLREATKGYDFRRVLKALDDVGAFHQKDVDQKSVNTRIPDGRQIRLYHIDPSKL